MLARPHALALRAHPTDPLPRFLRRSTVLHLTTMLIFGVTMFLLGQLLGVLQESPVHSAAYATLASSLDPEGLKLSRPRHEVAFAQRPSAPALRDMAFEWFNVQPEARAWMESLPVGYEASTAWGGRYLMDNRSVTIAQPYLHIVLHEYAHANLHHKGFTEKAKLLVGLGHLLVDSDPQHQEARTVLWGVLGDGAQAMRAGRTYALTHEAYAYLAQWSGGDLEKLPGYLLPAYADYLTGGTNQWLTWQAAQDDVAGP